MSWETQLEGVQKSKRQKTCSLSTSYHTPQPTSRFYTVLPKRLELTNLAAPNIPSVSHVAFAAVREEPTLWNLGAAAGVGAGLLASSAGAEGEAGLALADVDTQALQKELVRQGGWVHWPSSKQHC